MKFIPLAVLVLIVALKYTSSYSQPVAIKFKSSPQLRTILHSVTELQMFTFDGVVAMNQIKSVRFLKMFPDSATLTILKKADIEVFMGKEQESKVPSDAVKAPREFDAVASLGIGLGLDYGGIGGKLELFPAAPVGLFVGVGNNLKGVGWNGGMNLKFQPYQRGTLYVMGLYGYNSVSSSKIYYGFSGGMGGKISLSKTNSTHFSVAVIYPVRDQELQSLIDQGSLKASPILLSVGFNFNFN